MIIISYDIRNDKVRTKFSKYIMRFGERMQFSVYRIENGERILDNILADIKNQFMSQFGEDDSVILFKLSKSCEVIRMGYAKHEETDLIIV